jgi:hypothetical protein
MVDGLERIIEFILIGTLDKVDQEENDVMKNGRIRLRVKSLEDNLFAERNSSEKMIFLRKSIRPERTSQAISVPSLEYFFDNI